MPGPASPPPNLDQLQEELSFQEVLLESLRDSQDPDIDQSKEEITDNIKLLKEQIADMAPPVPNWQSDNSSRFPAFLNQTNGEATAPSTPSGSHHRTPLSQPFNPTMTLPNRKRPRNAFDDEFDSVVPTGNKSLRAPAPYAASPARSVDSFNTDFSDDPMLKRLLGDTYSTQRQSQQQYERDLEKKKQQEEEDAAFARQLHDEWLNNTQTRSFSPQIAVPTSSYSQSFLRHDGSAFQKPAVPKTERVRPENTLRPAPSPVARAFTPESDDSESGFEEISPDVWVGSYGSKPRRALPPMMADGTVYNKSMLMPGAFPGLSNPYSSTPGASVYGNSPYNVSQFNSSTSSLSNSYNHFGNNSRLNMGLTGVPGTSALPFDLDTYPLSSHMQYADPEQTQEELKNLMKNIRPDEELTPQQLAEIQPAGLRITLMPHQRKGYAWMKSMEEGTNKGGILADDMGLGKTVQALALILGRPPCDENGMRVQKPTLIVAPVALMQQWEREIEKMIHNSHRLNVLILHGHNRNSSWNDIKPYDVVLTTYGLLASDLKRKTKWMKYVEQVQDAKPTPQQQCPVLGDRSKFHRIILDEAQNIKNKSTKAAAAACRVQADYRWCLSGTPMQNNVDEIHSLIKFCRIRPYNDTEKFARDIGRPLKAKGVNHGREKAMKQLQALLRAVLLRRTKKSEIDGKPIIQLPEKHTVEDRAVFSKDELDFYKALEAKAQIQFNKYLKNGTVGRNYSHALVLLLRLRQCCCSPQLVTNTKDFISSGALQELDYIENARHLPKDVVKRLSDLDACECPICMDAVDNPIIFNPCGHSLCLECLSTMVDKAMNDVENYKVICPHCRASIDTNKVTDHESFLRVHYPDRPGVKPLEDDDDNDDNDTVSEVGDSHDDAEASDDDDADDDNDDGEDLKDFIVSDDEVENDSDAEDSVDQKFIKKDEESEDDVKPWKNAAFSKLMNKKTKTKAKDIKGKGRGRGRPVGTGKKNSKPGIRTLAQLRVEGLRNKAAKKKYLSRIGRGFQPSAKIDKTIRLLKDVRDNGQREKAIIFSSFTSFLDLLEVAINREDDDHLANYTRYDGSMTAKDRNEAVMRFTDDPRCSSMLVSLKAGNAGLNLTAANHVIILDPFWNPFVEYQAADRCYRIGQLREVTIHRVLIGEGDEEGNLIEQMEGSEQVFTVEDRILALQEKKRELVETALDETASGNIGRLGVRELGYLFGLNSMNG